MWRITPNGELKLIVSDFNRPNGLCFSPDGKTLYIADTEEHHIRAFDVLDDGSVTNDRIFAEVNSKSNKMKK